MASTREETAVGKADPHLIYFCDQCGFRIPSPDVAQGRARLVDETRATCAACSKRKSGGVGVPRQRDSGSSASTRRLAAPPPTEARSSQRTIQAAQRAGPSVVHERMPEVGPRDNSRLMMNIGIGVGVLIVIVAGVLLSGRPKPVNPPPTGSTPPKTAAVPATVPVLSIPGAPTPEPKNVPESTKNTDSPPPAREEEYDPRAAVAISLLTQAKNYYKQNPDDPQEFRDRLEKLKTSHAQTPAAAEAEKLLEGLKSIPRPVDRLESAAPESKEYTLVYDLNLNKLGGHISYTTDQRAQIAKPFDRIAYFVELQPNGAEVQYLYVSMEAFTDALGKIGVPTLASGARFQQNVNSMNVYSNVKDIVTGNGLEGGNIEFWPNNYGPSNSANVPSASPQAFDFGDQPTDPLDGYGSMQVHNHGAKQTLFAINHWGQGSGADLGIGNRPRDNPDWTFSNSAGTYRLKRLRVLVHCK